MKNAPRPLLLLLGLLLSHHLIAADATGDNVWKPFQFLLGDWVGSGSGKPGQGNGEFSVKFDLGKKILVRRNRAQLAPKSAENVGVTHEDLMIIYPQTGQSTFRAEYFDNEGHVIHYSVSLAEQKAVFQSDNAEGAPKFRLTYELKADGLLTIEFATAAPGKPLQTYITGSARRK